MFCSTCGTEIPENEQSCPKCAKVQPAAQGAEVPQPVATETAEPKPAETPALKPDIPEKADEPLSRQFQMPKSPSEALDLFKSTPLYIALAGCALMLISLFMPFATISFFVKMSVSYLSGDGKLALILILATAALLWTQKIKPAIGTHAVSILLVLFSAARVSGNADFSSMVTLNIGFYLYLIGAIIGAVGIFLILKEQPKAQ